MYTLEKEVRKGIVIFKVIDPWTLKAKDFFYFAKDKELPTLENYFFSAIKMLLESNKDKPYSRAEFNLWLTSTYNFGISETGRRLEIENSTLVFPLYKKLKYETYSEQLYFLSKKFTKKGIEITKKAIMDLKYTDLGEQEVELVQRMLSLLPKDTKDVEIYDEVKKLVCYEAEKTAIANAKEFQAYEEELDKKIKTLKEQD